MSDLQDALDETDIYAVAFKHYELFREAARRVANPDIEAAGKVAENHRPGVGPVTDRKRVTAIVNAALGVTEAE